METERQERIYSEKEIRELIWKEERVWGELAEEHRKAYTLRERMILMKPRIDYTFEEEQIYQELWTRRLEEEKSDHILQERIRQRLFLIFRHCFRKDMLDIFNSKSSEYPELKKIKITREAYEKANLISKRVSRVSRCGDEVYLLFLNEKSKEDLVIRDVYVPYQEVNASGCNIKVEKGKEDKENVERMGKRVMGWGHSHGNLSPFHSMTDIYNLRHIPSLHGTKITMKLGTFSSRNPYSFDVWYIPSLVFNARGARPSAAISIEYSEFQDYEPKIHINTHPRLEIVEERNGIEMRQDVIDREIWKKVKPGSGFRREFELRMLGKERTREKMILKREEELERKLEEVNLKRLTKAGKEERGEYRISLEEYLALVKEVYRLGKKTNMLEERVRQIEEHHIPATLLKRLFKRKI